MKKKKYSKVFVLLFSLIMVLTLSINVQAVTKKKVTITAKNQTVVIGTKNKSLGVKATKEAKVTYQSSVPSVVSVTSSGKITAKKAGTARITIKASKKGYTAASKVISVKVTKKTQKISASNKSVYVGSTKNIGAKASTGMTYKSSDTSVVMVNAKGRLTGKKAGTAYITITAKATATYNKATKKIKVTVVKETTDSILKVIKKPTIRSHVSVYAEIPELGVSYGVRENDVKYGASCMKFIYTYYAYCVKNWGNKKLTYKKNNAVITNTLKECAKVTLVNSDNEAARAIFEYIRNNSTRRAEFMKWMKKALGKEVPVLSDGYKYRIGYNSSSAYCPFTTAKEITTLWEYVWKDGYKGTNKLNIQRYKDFLQWSGGHKIGWLPYLSDKKISEWSVWTKGGFDDVLMGDGKEYTVFVSYMEDYFTDGSTSDNLQETWNYIFYLGNRELEKKGKLQVNEWYCRWMLADQT